MLENVLNLVSQLEAKYGLNVQPPVPQQPPEQPQQPKIPPQVQAQFKAADKFKTDTALGQQDYQDYGNHPVYGEKLKRARMLVDQAIDAGMKLDDDTIQSIIEEVMSSPQQGEMQP